MTANFLRRVTELCGFSVSADKFSSIVRKTRLFKKKYKKFFFQSLFCYTLINVKVVITRRRLHQLAPITNKHYKQLTKTNLNRARRRALRPPSLLNSGAAKNIPSQYTRTAHCDKKKLHTHTLAQNNKHSSKRARRRLDAECIRRSGGGENTRSARLGSAPRVNQPPPAAALRDTSWLPACFVCCRSSVV